MKCIAVAKIVATTLLVGLCLLACVASAARSKYQINRPECTTQYQQRTDKAVAKLLGFGPFGRKFPESYQQLSAFCRETSELVEQVYAYFAKCYKREIRDSANVLLYSIRSNIRTFCRKRTKKLAKLMEATACLNTGIHNDTCIRKYTDGTKQVIPLKLDDQMKIRHACCIYVDTMQCNGDFLDTFSCVGHRKEMLLDFVRGIFGSFVDIMCGEYNESTSRCDELGKAPKPAVSNRKKYTTPLFVLLDLLESLKNFDLSST